MFMLNEGKSSNVSKNKLSTGGIKSRCVNYLLTTSSVEFLLKPAVSWEFSDLAVSEEPEFL